MDNRQNNYIINYKSTLRPGKAEYVTQNV